MRLNRFIIRAWAGVIAVVLAGCQEQDPHHDASVGLNEDNALSVPLLPSAPCSDAGDSDRLASDMTAEINTVRAKANLKPLRTNVTLMQIADFYGCRLVDGHFFDHDDPFDGSTVDTRATDFGYAFVQIGENLAARQRTAHDAMEAFMKSPRHRANILDPIYTEVGIAVKIGGDHGIYWVQEFGRPLSDGFANGLDMSPAGSTTQPGVSSSATNSAPSEPHAGSPATTLPTSPASGN